MKGPHFIPRNTESSQVSRVWHLAVYTLTNGVGTVATRELRHLGRVCLVRIFIVDDSATARAALRAALEQRPDWVVVGEAFDGQHALTTFPLHMPHLTLMDFIMPKMNGIEAARHLTARHSDILILMVTADPSKELEGEARRAGIKGLCAKNEMQCLLKAVEALMDGGTYFSETAAA
jgi:DNA-binding NarL/FixJ family response regulator